MKRIKLLLVMLVTVLSSLSSMAHDLEVDGIYYNITSETDMTVEVTYGGHSSVSYSNEYVGNVIIPETVTHGTTYSVTSIGYEAFDGCSSLNSVTIPNSVTSIGGKAFYGCSGLTSVTIPNSVTSIGGEAFSGCTGLTSVTIPNSVTSIGNWFMDCSSLTSVTIPNSVTSIGDYAFYDCSGLTSVTIPNSVTSIGDYAFYDCSGLTSVTIPNSVTSIGEDAFYGCSGLTSVTIPNSVTSIGDYAFCLCSGLTSVTIPNSVTSIGYRAFRGCTGLNSVTIPNSVTSIGNGAFYDCSGLTSVTIPNSVTSIGNYAFRGCTGLNSVTIPNSVTSIGNELFMDCSSLTSVTIPNSVTSIGGKAFYSCSGLTSVTIPNSVTSIGDYAFEGCSGLTSVTIPNSVTSIGYRAFQGCSGLTSVTIPNSVTSIGGEAFSGCTGLTSVNFNAENCTEMGISIFDSNLRVLNIGNNVKNIPSYAFSGCSGLTSLTIPNSVTSIGEDAFQSCTDLTELILADGTETLSLCSLHDCPLKKLYLGRNYRNIDSPFRDISTLKLVTIGNSVTDIASDAFDGCSGLTELILADGTETLSLGCNYITSQKYGLFYDCPLEKIHLGRNLSYSIGVFGPSPFAYITSLKTVTISNSATSIGMCVFHGCTGLTSVTIPNSVTSIGEDAFYGCSGLTSVTIPNSVTSIGDEAFYGCTGLTSLTIGNSVTSIGNYAFRGCSGLTSLTIPNSVTSIGYHAFQDCTGIKKLCIEDSAESLSLSNSFYNSCNVIETLYLGRNITGVLFSGKTTLKEVTIGDSVSTIGDNEFTGCSGLTSVTIPNSVTSIGDSAFEGCTGLTEILIPKSVTNIGNAAFSGCRLKTVDISDCDSVIEIYSDCFSGNPIEHLYMGRNISGTPFNGFSTLKETTIGNHVTTIGDSAFSGCNKLIAGGVKCLGVTPPVLAGEWSLEQVEVPVDGLLNYAGADYWSDIPIIYAKDGDKTFAPVLVENNDNPCVMVNNTSSTGVSAIVNSNISVTKSDSASEYVMVRHCNNDITDKVADGYTFSASIYHKENTITTYSIDASNDYVIHVYPSGNLINQIDVNTVGNIYRLKITGDLNGTDILTIRKMTNLKILDMSEANIVNGGMSYYNEYTTSKNEIGAYFFKDKSNLEMVYLPKTATKVSNYAFGGCTKLSFVSIPDAMTYIAGNAFDQCTALASVRFEDGFNTFDFGTENDCLLLFKDCPVENLYLGRNISFTGSSPFKNKGTLSSVTIGDLVSKINDYMFYGCIGLSLLEMENSITAIGDYAFYNCRALPEFTIYDNVKTIGDYAFYGCKLIENIVMPNSLTKLGNYAFQLCEKLSSVKFGEAVNVIGNGAFKQCGSLMSIMLGNSVTTIGNEAFMQCDNLESVSFGNSVSSIGEHAFANCAKLNNVNIPPSVNTMGSSAFANCSNLKNVRIENGDIALDFGTTSTSGNCFANSPIEDLYVGRNISYYSEYSPFKSKTSMINLTIGDNTTTIKKTDYEGCAGLEYLVLGKAVNEIADYSFSGCTHLNTIYSLNTVPAKIYENTFNLVDKVNCMLYVPEGCKNIYWLHPYWEDFYNIIETNFTASTFEVEGISYSVISAEAQAISTYSVSDDFAVKVIAGESKYTGAISVPEMVNYFSNAYTVTHIDAYAFSGCVDLSAITLPTSIESIGNGALGGCSGLKEINAMGIIPADASETAFDGVDKNTCVLYVPVGCREAYANAPVWEEFYNIVEKAGIGNVDDIISDAESSNIEVIDGKLCINTQEEALVMVYSMSGAVAFNDYVDGELSIELPRGVYIVRVGSVTQKIVL